MTLENVELKRRLKELKVRDYEPSWMPDCSSDDLDIDSLACFVSPRSIDVLCGPVLHMATSKFRCRGDPVASKLCQVTKEPMVFIEHRHKRRLLSELKKFYVVALPNSCNASIAKKSVPVAKATLIRCLSRVTKQVWVVRHGLKDHDLTFLAKKLELIPH